MRNIRHVTENQLNDDYMQATANAPSFPWEASESDYELKNIL